MWGESIVAVWMWLMGGDCCIRWVDSGDVVGSMLLPAECRHFTGAKGMSIRWGKVMRDTKKLQIFIQQAHGVSSALWPASARRCISTGKAAQRRRSLIIQGKWWSPLANVTHIALLLALIGCSMFMGGMVVAALVQHRWYVLLI